MSSTRYDKNGWETTFATFLHEQYESGFTFDDLKQRAKDYIDDAGGWVPDDITKPEGLGEPANAKTPQEAVDEYLQGFADENTLISGTVTVQITPNVIVRRLSTDTDEAFRAKVEEAVASMFNGLPVEFVPSSLDLDNTSWETVGLVTATQRRNLEERRVRNEVFTPLDVARNLVIDKYTNDNTWNVYSASTTADGKNVVVRIIKYTDDTFETEEDSSVYGDYMITVDQSLKLKAVRVAFI